MNRTGSQDLIPEKSRTHAANPQGFALVVTLSLMILLTIIAVGLLTLSSISLRSASQGDAMQAARANAKMALLMAIGDLQKQLGPDTRISVTADQTAGADASTSSAPVPQKHWAGAYKSWPAALPSASRPTPEFLQWFVSGDPTKINAKDFATTAVSGNAVEIVTKNTVGSADPVKVPLITRKLSNGTKNNLAWWVSDLGTKGLVANSKELPTAVAETRADQQAAPNYHLKSFTDGRSIPTSGSKMPFMLLSYNAKTETGSQLGTRSLSRFNPKALHVDFYDLGRQEREMLPYEYTAEVLNGWKSNNDSLQQDNSGRGYFGGAMNAQDGTNYVTTHSVPREPIVSLAAFQHSFANGFDIQKPKYGYAILNAREPMLPQISHAIGNSLACPVIDSSKTEGTISGGRPVADHSYLANQALWDDWFLSGITPQTAPTFGRSRTQKTVAGEFFDTDPATHKKLPVIRYAPNLRGKTPTQIVNTYFGSTVPSNAATDQIASYLTVDGLFNVNSTSVEAWKSLLGARNGRPLVVRDSNGKEATNAGDSNTPVAGLLGPENSIAKGSGNFALNDPAQWVGRRTLTEAEIEGLANAIVKEVRKRGPFLSLADFINRRVGTNADLARAGAIQSALDSNDVPINAAYNSRAATGGNNLAFKQAEQGPISYGIPGIVKQADILTPIAPVLSARSDSFLIRGYGEQTDTSGKVIARAWCEAVVQRGAYFVDPADLPEKTYNTISTLNKNFGRRFDIVSFRWLNPSEA